MLFTARKLAASAIVSAGLLVLPGLALAGSTRPSKPVSNGNYCGNCTAKDSPLIMHVSTKGTSIDGWSYYNNCERLPVKKHPVIPISKAGTFSWAGALKDVTGAKLQFVLKGRFVSAHLIAGIVNATGDGRNCSSVQYKAKFTRTGPFQGF